MNNHYRILFVSALAAAAAVGTKAAWHPEFTFESQDEASRITDIPFLDDAYNAHSEISDGLLKIFPGDLPGGTSYSGLFTALHLDTDLKAASQASGGVVTVYFEIIQPTINGNKAINDITWGLSNKDPDTIQTDRFNSYSMMARINSGNDNFEIRDGSSFQSIAPLTADVHYKMWVVADYNLNYFEYYVQGGQWATQTHLGDDLASAGFFSFRINPAPSETVDYFLFGASRGAAGAEYGKDPTYFDNLYVDTTGQNLTDPTGAQTTWAGYSVSNGWVDTGAFMGELWVGDEPYSGWAWSAALNTWVYVQPDWVSAQGSWVYTTKGQ